MKLPDHVGSRLSRSALVTGEFFLHDVTRGPHIIREVLERFLAGDALVVKASVDDKAEGSQNLRVAREHFG